MTKSVLKAIIFTILLIFLVPKSVSAGRLDDLKKTLLAYAECADANIEKLFLMQYKSAKLLTSGGSKMKLFSTPFEMKHDYLPRAYSVYELETENENAYDAQINFLISKFKDFQQLKKLLGDDFAKSGVRPFYNCFYITTTSNELKTDVISAIGLEVERTDGSLSSILPSLSAEQRLKITKYMITTFQSLEEKGIVPFGVKLEHFVFFKPKKGDDVLYLRSNVLKYFQGEDIAAKLTKELQNLRKSDTWRFPSDFSAKFIFENRYSNNLFDAKFNRWVLAVLIANLWEIDFGEFFAKSSDCPRYYVDSDCVKNFVTHISDSINEKIQSQKLSTDKYTTDSSLATKVSETIARLLDTTKPSVYSQLVTAIDKRMR